MLPKVALREKDIEKLSAITGISVEDLSILHDSNMLNVSECRDKLIKCDYKRLISKKAVLRTKKNIISILSSEYHVSPSHITTVIYEKAKKYYYCEVCGIRISRSEYLAGKKCNKCICKSISI